MRFILVYKYGILQTKTERIDVNFCENTGQLIQYLQKRVGQASKQFIVRVKKGKVNYRVITGWPISHYGIKQGMEINLQLLEEPETQKQNKNININQRYLNNILGFKNAEMAEIVEEKEGEIEDDESSSEKQFNVRKYLDAECEKMLQEIRNKDHQRFLDIFQDFPQDIEQHQLIQLQKAKPFIIDELGEKGWGAIHYAIFYRATYIFNELLEMQADVNKCTSDGWLPIQLAIDLGELSYVQKLVNQPGINLNLVTAKGSPLHLAAKEGNKEIIMLLLDKDVDINIKDNHGKTVLDLCSDSECRQLLKKYEQKKQTYQQYVKGNLPISLTSIVRGNIQKAKRPFMNLKQRYIVIDPFEGSLIRYQTFNDYPKRPKQVTPLSCLHGMRMIDKEQMSFYMKKEMYYFIIEEPNKELYACKYKQTAMKWLQNLKQAIKFAQQLEKNPQIISQLKKNQTIIEDKPPELQEVIKKVKKNIFNLALGTRNSRSSVKSNQRGTFNSQQSHEYHTHSNGTHPPAVSNNNGVSHSQGSQNTNVPEVKADSKEKEINRVSQEAKCQESPVLDRKTIIKESKEMLSKELNQITTNKVNFSSFNIIRTLGSGAFGKVFLAKLISNGKLYALKALKKKNLILQKQLKYAIIEANILKQANHQFIINLHFAFQTPHYLYLALDYCPGRDLSFHLARQVTFPQDEARYYIAELCLAIEHLHEKNIIYRDLKPENILLDQKGHIKLADFGLSKQTNDDKTKSFCGSPAYLSPEMLSQKGAGKESDLYGIGAVLYEFLIGEPPYFSDDIPTLYKNIKEGKLKFPKNVSEAAKNLIVGLLERDPKKRLGSKNWNQIKQHNFFNSLDWSRLAKQELKPPERPEVDNDDGSDDELDIIKNTNVTKFTDFDYDDSTKKINRLVNFSFIRKGEEI